MVWVSRKLNLPVQEANGKRIRLTPGIKLILTTWTRKREKGRRTEHNGFPMYSYCAIGARQKWCLAISCCAILPLDRGAKILLAKTVGEKFNFEIKPLVAVDISARTWTQWAPRETWGDPLESVSQNSSSIIQFTRVFWWHGGKRMNSRHFHRERCQASSWHFFARLEVKWIVELQGLSIKMSQLERWF